MQSSDQQYQIDLRIMNYPIDSVVKFQVLISNLGYEFGVIFVPFKEKVTCGLLLKLDTYEEVQN